MTRKLAIEVSKDSLKREDENKSPQQGLANRRSFLKKSVAAGAIATTSLGLLTSGPSAIAEQEGDGNEKLTKGDAAILRFLAAAEIIESDLWLQYQELGGVQDDEVSKLASTLIPGYPPPTHRGKPFVHAGPSAPRQRHAPIHSRQHGRRTISRGLHQRIPSCKRRSHGESGPVPHVAKQQGHRREPVRAAHEPDATDGGYLVVDTLPESHG